METLAERLLHGSSRAFDRSRGVTGRRFDQRRSGASIVVLLAVAHIANDLVASMVAALLPTIRDRFALTAGTLALVVGLFSVSSSVSQPLLGAMIDRVGRRASVVAGLLVSVTLLSLIGIAPGVTAVVALLIVGGLGSAVFHPAGSGAARAAGSRPDLAVGLFTGGGMLGLAIGPILLLALVSEYGTGYLPWVMIPGVVLAAVLYRAIPAGGEESTSRTARVFDWSLLSGPVGRLTIIGVLLHLAFGTFSSAVPLWLVSRHGAGPADPLIGWTLSVFFLAAALGGVAAGVLGHRIHRGCIIGGSLMLAPVPLLLVLASDPGSLVYFVAVATSGALVNAGFPLLITAAQNAAPRSASTATGMVMGLSVGMAGVIYAIVGQFQEALGLETSMILVFLTLIPAAILTFRSFPILSPEGRRADFSEVDDYGSLSSPCRCTRLISCGGAEQSTENRGCSFEVGARRCCPVWEHSV